MIHGNFTLNKMFDCHRIDELCDLILKVMLKALVEKESLGFKFD